MSEGMKAMTLLEKYFLCYVNSEIRIICAKCNLSLSFSGCDTSEEKYLIKSKEFLSRKLIDISQSFSERA